MSSSEDILQFRTGDLIEIQKSLGRVSQRKWLILDNGTVLGSATHVYKAFWFPISEIDIVPGKEVSLLFVYPKMFKYNLLSR